MNVLNVIECEGEIPMDMFSFKRPVRNLNPGEVDEMIERIIMAKSVDPSQVAMNQPSTPHSPELDLHRAILFDAVQCVVRHADSPRSGQRAEARSALRWIQSDDESYFLSFVPLCHRFQIDPEWIRRLVRNRMWQSHQSHMTEAAEAA